MPTDEIVEMQIRYLETLLKRYTEIADKSGMSFSTQEETVDRILMKLKELYKLRDKKSH